MTTIADDQLFIHGARAKGKVVVLTGGANEIGKETAMVFAKHGAKLVIGDVDTNGGEAVVAEVQRVGAEAVFIRCNVTVWDDLVALYELAIERFGSVDIVIPNAGVAETNQICDGNVALQNGRPVQPPMKTIETNLTAVLHTVHLGLYYMKMNRKADDWKALVLIGSMASSMSIPEAPQYTASKHAILGLARSLEPALTADNIRVSVIHPWLADTKILALPVGMFFTGVPLMSVPRIAGAIFYSATDPDVSTTGCPWMLPDDGPVYRLDKEQLTLGVYDMMNQRAKHVVSTDKSPIQALQPLSESLIFPLSSLPDWADTKQHRDAPTLHFGFGLTFNDLAKYCKRKNIILKDQTLSQDTQRGRALLSAKLMMSKHCDMSLKITVPIKPSSFDFVFVLYTNYSMVFEQLIEKQEEEIIQRFQSEWETGERPMWFADISFELPIAEEKNDMISEDSEEEWEE